MFIITGLQSLETTAPEATATVEPEATTPEISSTAGDTKSKNHACTVYFIWRGW